MIKLSPLASTLTLVASILAARTATAAFTTDWVNTVQADATVQASPPQITLRWKPEPTDEGYGASSYAIYRKAKSATSWGTPIATLDGSAQTYSDNNVSVGSTYEYQIVKTRIQNGTLAYGYVYSAINAPLTDSRGKLVLVVATNSAAPLAVELARLQSDLIGDGWQVIRHDVSSNDAPAHVRSLIVSDYNADSANVNTVFLFGHVPILQSGFINYDGHGPRPMPADGFYGDMNGDWSSSPSTFPSTVELMVGRVDLADMPGNGAPSPWPNETELLRNYLNKDHRWRFKQMTADRRALIADRFETLEPDGETRASTGYRSFGPFVGFENTIQADVSDAAAPGDRWISVLSSGGTWLWTYGNGGGQDTSISELGTHGLYNDVWSTDMYSQDPKVVFFMLEGSHFGNWDRPDNIMRSVLAMPTMGLSVYCIAGHPQYYVHHMGLGETLGYGVRLTMNNTTLYQDTTNEFQRSVYIALMGDPTLRMDQVAPVPALNATASGTMVNLSWTASPDAAGYHVYRASSPSGPFERLTGSLLSGTSYQDVGAPSGTSTYMLRAVALASNPSGSYYNASQGVFVNINPNGPPDTPPTISAIADQTVTQDTSTSPITFSVNDAETSPANLVLQGTSSDQNLVPDSSIIIGGSGQNRSVTITPAAGQTGSATISMIVSDGTLSTTTSFLLTVTPAVTNGPPDPALVSGTYSGLFYEADQVRPESSGAIELSLERRGNYTGRLQLGTRRYSFRGVLDDQLAATNLIAHGHEQPITLSFQAGVGDQFGQINGQVARGSWVADLVANRSAFSTRTNRAPWSGNYTLVFPGTAADSSLPAGDGYAFVRVTTTGSASMAGSLADGTSFSESAPVSNTGFWPVYVPLYSGQGALIGWLAFTNRADDDISGTVDWIKPADARARTYPAGFSEQIPAIGSVYHKPPGTNHVLDLNNAFVAFHGGNLSSDFTNNVTMSKSGRITNQSANRLTLSFSLANGKFSGSVTDPASGKPMPFSGVAFQRRNSAFGFLLSNGQSSEVTITPQTAPPQ